jgi:hypothetical protein
MIDHLRQNVGAGRETAQQDVSDMVKLDHAAESMLGISDRAVSSADTFTIRQKCDRTILRLMVAAWTGSRIRFGAGRSRIEPVSSSATVSTDERQWRAIYRHLREGGVLLYNIHMNTMAPMD